MLFATALLYFLLGDRRDAWVILAAVLPVLLVDVLLEARSKRALMRLEQAAAPKARVMRDGRETLVPEAGLVRDDLLLLREGDRVP
ncbi:MAG TPA: hypothetical protein VFR02_04420, partial [bacterium]|nr:hypothetical protein [bacterium]